ncbi:MAG: hypothetical protein WBM00_04355, partial [Solirubrobacterales bacterium]
SAFSSTSAGYRFGTTRVVHPGASVPPPAGLTAKTSGGVRSSCPSQSGQSSGPFASLAGFRKPSGRCDRPGARIARRPVS